MMNDLLTPHIPALWQKMSRRALNGIFVMVGLAVIDVLFELADTGGVIGNGYSWSDLERDMMTDIAMSVFVAIGTLVGALMHASGISGMREAADQFTAGKLSRVRNGFYWFVIAAIIDAIPLLGKISFIFYIVAFVLVIGGYSSLGKLPQLSMSHSNGFKQAQTASVCLLVGYVLPKVGGLISLAGYVLYIMAWLKINSMEGQPGAEEAGGSSAPAETDEERAQRVESELILSYLKLDDEKLRELVTEDSFASERVAEACRCELEHRFDVKAKAEEARKKAEQESRERKARRKAWWKKYRIAVFAALALALLATFAGWWCSDGHRYNQALACFDRNDPEGAMEYYAMVTNPRSMEYSPARYSLAMHHLEQGDTATAVRELTNSVSSGRWEYIDAYQLYTELLETGEWSPHLRIDYKAAADLLSKSDEVEHQMNAIRLYYETSNYDKALSICNQYSNYYYAQGFKGLMHLYGKGGLEKDARRAWNLLQKAPDVEPFLIPKADLELFFSEHVCNTALNEAVRLYALAAEQSPNRADYAMRLRVASSLAKARDKERDRWQVTGTYWHYYYFNNETSRGSYSGEVYRPNYNSSASPNGWGVFKFSDNETWIGKYKMLKRHGEGISIIPSNNSIFVKVGTFVNDEWEKGYQIDTDGRTYFD